MSAARKVCVGLPGLLGRTLRCEWGMFDHPHRDFYLMRLTPRRYLLFLPPTVCQPETVR